MTMTTIKLLYKTTTLRRTILVVVVGRRRCPCFPSNLSLQGVVVVVVVVVVRCRRKGIRDAWTGVSSSSSIVEIILRVDILGSNSRQ